MAKDAKKGHKGVNRPNIKAEKVKKELIASLLQSKLTLAHPHSHSLVASFFASIKLKSVPTMVM